ncbi:MAG TPA: hypothetical protein VGN20_06590 [Mucilaginibacter sp.]|jgi:hypothetical protein
MKKYLPLMMLLASLLIYRCSKELSPVSPPVVPAFAVKDISLPHFVNSNWSNVTGGEMLIKLDKLDASGAITTTINDSVAYNNIAAYSKTLASGTYNATITSSGRSVADTFIRISAQVKSLSITNKEAASLTATTYDGLITVGKNLIQDGTVPSFKSDSGANYKFGLANGFYFLYVKGGSNGTLSLTAQANGQTETLNKHISIGTLNQYNVALQKNNGSIKIVFAPFAYNQVQVSSSTLLTINMNPDNSLASNAKLYFVVTDADGNVLNSVQYLPGASTFKLGATQPYEQTRFNFFEIYIPNAANEVPGIIGFLQVKKGSTYTSDLVNQPAKLSSALNIKFQNFASFDQLNISTDNVGNAITSSSDLSSISATNYSAGSKLWIQMLQNNQYFYNFFSIPNGSTSLNVNANQLTETPAVAAITSPGSNLSVQVMAKTDTRYANFYNFGITRSQYNQLNYYYPTEQFKEYDALMHYQIGNFNYTIVTAGTTIPGQVASFDASFNVQASTLANFTPSVTGTYDYYQASFSNIASASNLQVDLYSPSAAGYTNIKLPDFSKYLGISSLDLNTLALKSFGVYQVDGFNETSFFYKNYHSYFNINSKAIEENY